MKNSMVVFLLTVLFLSSSLTRAQTCVEPCDSNPSSESSLNLDHFQVVGYSPLYLNGKPYTRLDFDLKPEYRFNYRDALLLGNIAATGAAAYGVIAWNPQQDKVRHFLAGYVVGNVTNATFQLILPEKMKHRRLVSALLGLGAGALIGTAKEVYDAQGHGTPDVKDAVATALGGGLGTLTISFDLKQVFKRRPQPQY